jgi:hypothetical protein
MEPMRCSDIVITASRKLVSGVTLTGLRLIIAAIWLCRVWRCCFVVTV